MTNGTLRFAALMAALLIAFGTAGGVLAQTARINSIIPADRVFYPGEDVKLRLVLMFERPLQLEKPEVRYEVSEVESGTVVARGAAPFNPTVAAGGWAELRPDFPRDSTPRWYRVDLSFWNGDQAIPFIGAESPGARISFGVLPDGSEAYEWSVEQVEPVDPSRKVMAFYYPWYGNPSVTNQWVHWPEGGHNPDAYDEHGLPDVGATHHPALGPYDSNDPRVIKQHLAWAEAAGIDVLIATWWGQGEFSDRALRPLLDAAAETNVRISLYYETVPGGREDGALKDFRYILSRYGEHPGLFKHEGEPVIFVYGRAMSQIPRIAWQRVIQTIKSEYGVKLIADSLDGSWADIFDGLHMYNPVGPVVGGSDMRRIYDSFVWAAESRGKVSSVTVIPGYDDSNIGRTAPIVAPREDGALYDELWELAIESRPEWILITSFNEWHEGSEIEPSVEYGDQYLRSTASWAAKFKAASERTLWVERSSMPAVVSPGTEHSITIDVVRRDGEGSIGMHWDLPSGWTTEGQETGDGEERSIVARLFVPDDAALGEQALQLTLSWQGFDLKLPAAVTVVERAPFEGAGVWVDLGAENRAHGLDQRDQADGVTAPANVDGIEARQTAPGVSSSKYMYFDVADRFLFDASGVEVEIGIEYLDKSLGTFRVQYDSSNPWAGPLDGAYTDAPAIRMLGTGEWKTAVVKIPDARFANRQNGGADFRLAVGSNDLTVRRVWVRIPGETLD